MVTQSGNQDLGHRKRGDDKTSYTIAERGFLLLSYIFCIITFPLSLLVCLHIASEYERYVVLRFGRLRSGRPLGPGIVWVLVCVDDSFKVDLRTASFSVPSQEILTKDSVTVTVDAVIYFRYKDPLSVVLQVYDAEVITKLLAQTTLRNVANTKRLFEFLTQKQAVSAEIQEILDEVTKNWGVKVERVEIKDIKLPVDLQRAMAVEQEAHRVAKAKVAAAEGELKASVALKEASDVIGQNPIALQLRYLQTLQGLAGEETHNIIFPFPIEFIEKLLGK